MTGEYVQRAVQLLADGAEATLVESAEPPVAGDGEVVVAVEDVTKAVEPEKRPVVFYHLDLDGVCSAAVANRLASKLGATAEFIGINYGHEFPWGALDRALSIWMVDFGLQPFEDMERLGVEALAKGVRLVWIDHHQSSLDAAEIAGFNPEGIRRQGEAGCELTWEFAFPDEPMPPIVRFTGRYDVWDHSDPRTLPIHYAMESKGITPQDARWPDLMAMSEEDLDPMVADGQVIMDYLANLYAEHMAGFAFEVEFEGLSCIVANVVQHGSTQFESVAEGHDASIRFAWSPAGKCWTVSMYAIRDGVNVADICERHGGGGHPGAAGFQCQALPFELSKAEPVGKSTPTLEAALSVEIAIAKLADGGTEERYTLGIVLEPNDGQDGAPLDPDTQGDIYDAKTIRVAQRLYMKNFQRIGRQHGRMFADSEGTLVDCFIVPMESDGLDIKTPDGTVRHVRPGTWLQGVLWSSKVWAEIQAGTFTGWSIGGKGFRTALKAQLDTHNDT